MPYTEEEKRKGDKSINKIIKKAVKKDKLKLYTVSLNDNRAVTAVIGVILLVAIVVAIACVVYVYVDGILSHGYDIEYVYISGEYRGNFKNEYGITTYVVGGNNITMDTMWRDCIDLDPFLGEEIILVLSENPSSRYDYYYLGAYLS